MPILIVIILIALWLANAGGKEVTGYKDGQPFALTVYPVGNGQYAEGKAAAALHALQALRRAQGLSPLFVTSAFRSNEAQQQLYAQWLAGTGNKAAKPGYSEHQQGLAFDFAVGSQGYNSETYFWLSNHAPALGFYESVDGEPWHWSYWGKAFT